MKRMNVAGLGPIVRAALAGALIFGLSLFPGASTAQVEPGQEGFVLDGDSMPGPYGWEFHAVDPLGQDAPLGIPDLWDSPVPEEAAPAESAPDAAIEPEAYGHEVAADTLDDTLADALDDTVGIAQIATPQLLAPQPGEVVTGLTAPPTGMPTLEWAPVFDANRYEVQISAAPGFASTLVSRVTYALSYTHFNSLADGTYYWRVRARVGNQWGEYSQSWSFTKDWSHGEQLRPVPIAPEDQSLLSGFAHDHFRWEPVAGAAAYLLEIANDTSFNQITYSDTTIKPHHTPDKRLENSTFYWRVFPLDNQGNRGASSDVWRFTFLWDAPPVLLAPADALQTPFLPQFSWEPVPGARRYQLELATDREMTNITSYLTANTDFTPEKALPNDEDYYWRVKAIDANNVSTRYSEVRQFSLHWHIQPQLLTPANNAIMLSYPFFSWTPVPEAERYQIQIADNANFNRTIGDERIFNSTAYTQPRWQEVFMNRDYFWRVRAIDAQGNFSKWSTTYSFRLSVMAGPNLIYPHFYYPPDVDNLPVHEDRTIAWPLFLWDSAHNHPMPGGVMAPQRNRPDFYRLTVSESDTFDVVNFEIDTMGLAAVPTLENPFVGLEEGKLYFWRVRALYHDDLLGETQLGVDTIWRTRYAAAANVFEVADEMRIMHPPDAAQAVEVPPVLGWLPVEDAHHYRVQLSLDRAFNEIVEEAQPQFIYYVPWQNRLEEIPPATYWWRVRAEDEGGAPLADWSEARHFHVSQEAIMGNPHDFPVEAQGLFTTTDAYNPELTRLARNEAPPTPPSLDATNTQDYSLGALHMMPDRSHQLEGESGANYSWLIGFEVAAAISETVQYGIYFNSHRDPAFGATFDPLNKPIPVDDLYRPDYVVYIVRTPENVFSATYFRLQTSGGWAAGLPIVNMGGMLWFDDEHSAVNLRMPYTSLGSSANDFSGSLAVTVFSSAPGNATGMLASVPTQPGPAITRPALIADMLMPLYPFNTPLWNPQVHYEVPVLRWRMPYFNSVDGYEIEVALDDQFTQIVETWESFESGTSPFFALLPTAFQSKTAHGDNESYFWRVRLRYERHGTQNQYERSSWSPPMRYKLTSYTVGNPVASSNARLPIDPQVDEQAGATAGADNEPLIVHSSPTFSWGRVEGAAGYRLWVSQDANFGTRIIDKQLDTVSYTPQDALPDGTYYWMVAPRRANRVFGSWSPVYTFVKESIAPTPLAPVDDEVVNGQPTFRWDPLYFNDDELRLAAPRYRLQVADEINFSNPVNVDTQATSFTLSRRSTWRRLRFTDGTWYWRVAAIDANGNVGTYSAIQQFRKEYVRPELISPAQGPGSADAGETLTGIPSFVWSPVHGAAYYEVRVANTPQDLERSANAQKTDSTRFTPVTNLTGTDFYWRVQMFDVDNIGGPTVEGWAIVPKAEEPLADLFVPFVYNNFIE